MTTNKLSIEVELMGADRALKSLEKFKGPISLNITIDLNTGPLEKAKKQAKDVAKDIESSFMQAGKVSSNALVEVEKQLKSLYSQTGLIRGELSNLSRGVGEVSKQFSDLPIAAQMYRKELQAINVELKQQVKNQEAVADSITESLESAKKFNDVVNSAQGSGRNNGSANRGRGASGRDFQPNRPFTPPPPAPTFAPYQAPSSTGRRVNRFLGPGRTFTSGGRDFNKLIESFLVSQDLGLPVQRLDQVSSLLSAFNRQQKVQQLRGLRAAAKAQTAKTITAQASGRDFGISLFREGIVPGSSNDLRSYEEFQNLYSQLPFHDRISIPTAFNSPSQLKDATDQVKKILGIRQAAASSAAKAQRSLARSQTLPLRRFKAAQRLATTAGIGLPSGFATIDDLDEFIYQARQSISQQRRSQSIGRNYYGTERQRVDRANKELDRLNREELGDPSNILRIANRFNVAPGKLDVKSAGLPLRASRLSNPETAIQLGFAGAFGGIPSLVGALALGATKLGPGGAVLGSTITQAILSRFFDPAREAFTDFVEQFKEAGIAFNRSILGIAAVNQANSVFVGAGGQELPIGQQLGLQAGRARQIQLSARAKLLPLGIAGQTEATFVQGIVSALSQRGFQASPDQIARIAELTGGAIQAQRPGLLENTQLLLRDIQDVFGGGPQATRTILSQLIRPSLGGLTSARSTEAVVKALERGGLGSFAEAAKGLDNPIVQLNKLAGAFDLLKTNAGDKLLDALTPALKRFLDALDPATESGKRINQLAENIGTSFGEIVGSFTDFNSSLLTFATNFKDTVIPVTEASISFAKAVPNILKDLQPLLTLASVIGGGLFLGKLAQAAPKLAASLVPGLALGPIGTTAIATGAAVELVDIIGTTIVDFKSAEIDDQLARDQERYRKDREARVSGTLQQKPESLSSGILAALGLTETQQELEKEVINQPQARSKYLQSQLTQLLSAGQRKFIGPVSERAGLTELLGLGGRIPLSALTLTKDLGQQGLRQIDLRKQLLQSAGVGDQDIESSRLAIERREQEISDLEQQLQVSKSIVGQKDLSPQEQQQINKRIDDQQRKVAQAASDVQKTSQTIQLLTKSLKLPEFQLRQPGQEPVDIASTKKELENYNSSLRDQKSALKIAQEELDALTQKEVQADSAQKEGLKEQIKLLTEQKSALENLNRAAKEELKLFESRQKDLDEKSLLFGSTALSRSKSARIDQRIALREFGGAGSELASIDSLISKNPLDKALQAQRRDALSRLGARGTALARADKQIIDAAAGASVEAISRLSKSAESPLFGSEAELQKQGLESQLQAARSLREGVSPATERFKALTQTIQELEAKINDLNYQIQQASNEKFTSFNDKLSASAIALDNLRKGLDSESQSRQNLIISTESVAQRLYDLAQGARGRELEGIIGAEGVANQYKQLTGGLLGNLPSETLAAIQNPALAADLQRQSLEEQASRLGSDFANLPKTQIEQEAALQKEIQSNSDAISNLTEATKSLRDVYQKSLENLFGLNKPSGGASFNSLFNYGGVTSSTSPAPPPQNALVEKARKALGSINPGIRALIGQAGVPGFVANSLSDINPSLKNIHPTGYESGASFSDSAGAFYDRNNGFVGLSTLRSDFADTARHEYGHAFDFKVGNFSTKESFLKAYLSDASKYKSAPKGYEYFFPGMLSDKKFGGSKSTTAEGLEESVAQLFDLRYSPKGEGTYSGLSQILPETYKLFNSSMSSYEAKGQALKGTDLSLQYIPSSLSPAPPQQDQNLIGTFPERHRKRVVTALFIDPKAFPGNMAPSKESSVYDEVIPLRNKDDIQYHINALKKKYPGTKLDIYTDSHNLGSSKGLILDPDSEVSERVPMGTFEKAMYSEGIKDCDLTYGGCNTAQSYNKTKKTPEMDYYKNSTYGASSLVSSYSNLMSPIALYKQGTPTNFGKMSKFSGVTKNNSSSVGLLGGLTVPGPLTEGQGVDLERDMMDYFQEIQPLRETDPRAYNVLAEKIVKGEFEPGRLQFRDQSGEPYLLYKDGKPSFNSDRNPFSSNSTNLGEYSNNWDSTYTGQKASKEEIAKAEKISQMFSQGRSPFKEQGQSTPVPFRSRAPKKAVARTARTTYPGLSRAGVSGLGGMSKVPTKNQDYLNIFGTFGNFTDFFSKPTHAAVSIGKKGDQSTAQGFYSGDNIFASKGAMLSDKNEKSLSNIFNIPLSQSGKAGAELALDTYQQRNPTYSIFGNTCLNVPVDTLIGAGLGELAGKCIPPDMVDAITFMLGRKNRNKKGGKAVQEPVSKPKNLKPRAPSTIEDFMQAGPMSLTTSSISKTKKTIKNKTSIPMSPVPAGLDLTGSLPEPVRNEPVPEGMDLTKILPFYEEHYPETSIFSDGDPRIKKISLEDQGLSAASLLPMTTKTSRSQSFRPVQTSFTPDLFKEVQANIAATQGSKDITPSEKEGGESLVQLLKQINDKLDKISSNALEKQFTNSLKTEFS